jgi:putative flippase GtrA
MVTRSRLHLARTKLIGAWGNRAVGLKAISFGLIGAVNTTVDYAVFLLARAALARSAAALGMFVWLADSCRCGNPKTILLIIANVTAWLVAVTGSYIMNSSITFAAESRRKLRWRAYTTFIVSGIAGLIANTAALVFAAEILLLPILFAKAIAICASFIVNFLLAHFVVFHTRGVRGADDPGGQRLR